MPQYAILRFAKHKGNPASALEAHHERVKEQYNSNPDIDTDRSSLNFHIIEPTGRYFHQIQKRITESECRTRKDSTRFVDTLITASPEFFVDKSTDEIREFFKTTTDFLKERLEEKNIISAIVHMDERTPHLHLVFVPLTKDKRLSAKDILGNRADLSKWQDAFYSTMVKKYPDLERGESAKTTGRQHIPTRVFKQAAHLTEQMKSITDLLNSINPINTGKKKEEILQQLVKFFPQMESFETLVRKYRKGFEILYNENQELKSSISLARSSKYEDNGKIMALEDNLASLQRYIKNIPDDIKKELELRKSVKQINHQERYR